MSDTVRTLTAAIATAVRTGRPHEADWLRSELRTEKLAAQIRETLAQSPPLTAEQVERLRDLLPLPAVTP